MVVKGVQFRNHEIIGDIVPLAQRYADEGADELVFYDITASSDNRIVDKSWVERISEKVDIPFCVAGGIKSIEDAAKILAFGADKISINSPALANPQLITDLTHEFGQQCIVVGIDSYFDKETGLYQVKQFTGDETKTRTTQWQTLDWVKEVQARGAGEIVLNVMNKDGTLTGSNTDLYTSLVVDWPQIDWQSSGGIGSLDDIAALNPCNVAGVIVGRALLEDKFNVKEAIACSQSA